MYSYVSEYHSYVAVFTRILLAYGGVYLFVTPGVTLATKEETSRGVAMRVF